MQIRGREVDFKISRPKDAEKMNIALKHMDEVEKELKKETDIVAILTKFIKVLRDFFVEATGADVLDDCDDAEEAKQTYLDFCRDINEQKSKVLSSISPNDIK